MRVEDDKIVIGKFKIPKDTVFEIMRFGIVGCFATLLHYGIYWILQHWIEMNIAYTIGYGLSFLCNFYLTSHFTFKKEATVKRGLGFSGAHLTNYLNHIFLLNLFVWLGIPKQWAPIPVYCIAIPVNFMLVRFVFKHGNKN